jgi:hypothetical protein
MSAIGQPAEGEAQPPEGGEQTTTTPETTQPAGLDRIYERMDEMTRSQQEFLTGLQQTLTPPEQEEEEFDPADFYTDTGELTEDGARALIGDLVQQQVEQQLAPREAARLVQERDESYEALKDEYPDLRDEKVAQGVLRNAIEWARGHNPGLIDRPEFVDVIEAFYKAQKFDELRQTQAADQPRSVVLESAQGAARQTQQPQVDWGERITKAAERLRPQI